MVFSVTLATNHRVNSLCPVHVYVNGHVIYVFRFVIQMQVISETVLKLSVSKNTNVHVD